MDDRPRWERDADRVRRAAPGWLDMERVPWWLWALMGTAWGVQGVYVLLGDGHSATSRAAAIVVLLLVAPSQFVLAVRRRRGEPVYRERQRQ